MSTSKLNEEFFNIVKVAKSLTMVNGTPAVANGNFEYELSIYSVAYFALCLLGRDSALFFLLFKKYGKLAP